MKNNTAKIIKWTIGISILAFMTIQTYLHQILGGAKAPSIHALCPYGGLEAAYTLFSEGKLIDKIFSATIVLFIAIIILTLIFRNFFCGVICPFGTLQSIFGHLGKIVFRKRHRVPDSIDRPLRYAKYVVLAATTFMAWKTSGLWMSPYDPWAAYAHIGSGKEFFNEYIIGALILIAVLIGSILYEKFFCKYLCPMGAFLSLISFFSPSKIIRDKNKCINCGLCAKKCPMNIDVAKTSEVKSLECISCHECTLSCPVENALNTKLSGLRLSPAKYISITVLIFFSIIASASLSGNYQITQTIAEKGEINTIEDVEEKIKGFMTINEVSDATGIPLEKIYEKAGFTSVQVPPDTKCKEIGDKLGKSFETSNLREIIKEILDK